MQFKNIPVPEIYRESWDFRFFLKWIWECFSKVKYDTEHLVDIYDPLKCKEELLWMLGDTIGWKYDDRLPASYNRLVMLYFMNMIRKKGSKAGVAFAAELNLAQFNLISYGVGYEDDNNNVVKGKSILNNRLEDTSVPSNAVYVTPHTREGYIDVVYFSTEKPIDACIEYVRPLGMYLFQHSGVRFDARTQISIDARLTNITDNAESIGSTHVGHYTRNDYARMQQVNDYPGGTKKHIGGEYNTYIPEVNMPSDNLHVFTDDSRDKVWYRNPTFEVDKYEEINPGYRALYSLQLCNNEHIVKALIDPMFSLGYGPQLDSDSCSDESYYIKQDNVTVVNPKSYLVPAYQDKLYPTRDPYNLRYDRNQELSITEDVVTLDEVGSSDKFNLGPGTKLKPIPAVNPIMSEVGDAIALNDVKFSNVDEFNEETGDAKISSEYLGRDEEE